MGGLCWPQYLLDNTDDNTRRRANTFSPAQMGGDEEDVSPELNIVLTAAAQLHLLPPDGEHLLLQWGKLVSFEEFRKDVKSC